MHPKSILFAILLGVGTSSVFAQPPFLATQAPYAPSPAGDTNRTGPPQETQAAATQPPIAPAHGSTAGPTTSGKPSVPPPGQPTPADSAYPTLTPSDEPTDGNEAAAERDSNPLGSLLTVVSSLAIVLGLFFVLVWFLRRASPHSQSALPTGVVEMLGRAPLAGRQQMHLLRVGAKLVLISVTPDGTRPITEITDPDEVTRLAGLCRQSSTGSVTQSFRQVLGDFARDKSVAGVTRGNSATEQPHA